MSDNVNKYARKDYFKAFYEKWVEELENDKKNKDLIIEEFINNENMFCDLPSTQRKRTIKEFVEFQIKNYEDKLNKIKKEIEE